MLFSPLALSRAVLFHLSLTVGSAPSVSSVLTAEAWPYFAATIRGVILNTHRTHVQHIISHTVNSTHVLNTCTTRQCMGCLYFHVLKYIGCVYSVLCTDILYEDVPCTFTEKCTLTQVTSCQKVKTATPHICICL